MKNFRSRVNTRESARRTCLRAGIPWVYSIFSHDVSPSGNRTVRRLWANSETKMKNFVRLSRQFYWVPNGQKSTASSPNPLGPFLDSAGSLFSPWAGSLIFDPGASYCTVYIIYRIPTIPTLAAKTLGSLFPPAFSWRAHLAWPYQTDLKQTPCFGQLLCDLWS
jgi:hypothetical protein